MGNDENILSLETLKNIYELAATNLKFARQRYQNKAETYEPHVKEGSLVLIKNNTKRGFETKISEGF